MSERWQRKVPLRRAGGNTTMLAEVTAQEQDIILSLWQVWDNEEGSPTGATAYLTPGMATELRQALEQAEDKVKR